MWLMKLLANLFGAGLEPTFIHYDNQSCMKLLENLVFHDRSKQIEMRYHYIVIDMVYINAIILQYALTDENTTDVLTKSYPR